MELLLGDSGGLGIGALTIAACIIIVLFLIYIVMMLEHRKEMHERLDKVESSRLEKDKLIAKNSTFNREEDLEVLICDLRVIEKRLAKIGNNPDARYRNLIRVTIKRIKATQDLLYDLSRYFSDHKYSVRIKTDESKKITCQSAREAINAYRELEEILLGTAPIYEKDIKDIAGELDAYVYREAANLIKKVEKINQDLRA